MTTTTRRAGVDPPVPRPAPAAPATPGRGAARLPAEPPLASAGSPQTSAGRAAADRAGTEEPDRFQDTRPAGTHQGRTWTITMPAGMELLNANDHDKHWGRRYRIGNEIKKAAWACVLAAKIPQLARARILIVYEPPATKRRRDTDNLFASAKPTIDGIVAAGILADDSSAYIASTTLEIGSPHPLGRLVLHIYEITENGDGT